jgi:hypothetical protein
MESHHAGQAANGSDQKSTATATATATEMADGVWRLVEIPSSVEVGRIRSSTE